MDLQRLMDYKIWAEEVYIDYISKLSEEEFNKSIIGYEGTIRKIIVHLLNVNWYWTTFITDQNYDDNPNYDTYSKNELVEELRKFNDQIIEIIKNENLQDEFVLQDGDTKVITTRENVLTNFVTHSAYHRGQIAIFLRYLGFETIKETDFNPYIYEVKQ